MIVATDEILVTLAELTGVDLVQQRMVDLLFPAVGSRAKSLQRASLVVVADERTTLPVLAQLVWVVVE